MIFNSWSFALFLVIVLASYYCLRLRSQNLLLLGASYFFYGWWDWRFCSLLLISTVVDYHVGRHLHVAEGRKRKLLLLLSVVVNLGILGFFKYWNFFVDSAAGALTALGLNPNLPFLEIVLPVGISFYTFQTMAYTIDVYRRKLEPATDPVAFGVYVAYFPQLVAGPIERATHLLPQITSPRRVNAQMFGSGILLILIGLVRKVAIADTVAPYVESAFDRAGTASGTELVLGVVLFAIQIYCDFAGYSDIARGTSRLFGIELMENFHQPYFATSITEFWRRWHISLSTWLRDYLYIPLGGNRGPAWFVYRNLMLTMLLGGLWHGASWNFVIWGGIHGVALVLDKMWRGNSVPLPTPLPMFALRRLMSWLLTMAVVLLAWIFFRSPDFGTTIEYLQGIVQWRVASGSLTTQFLAAAGFITLLLAIDVPQAVMNDHTAILRLAVPLRAVVYASLVLLLVLLHSDNDVAFIYFQF